MNIPLLADKSMAISKAYGVLKVIEKIIFSVTEKLSSLLLVAKKERACCLNWKIRTLGFY